MSEVRLILGDCVEELAGLEAGSVQCCVTSPPYFGLRDYGTDGQIGLEQTPEAYVANLVAVFREVRRVLRDDGTLWLNLGDSYASSGVGHVIDGKNSTLRGGKLYDGEKMTSNYTGRAPTPDGLKPKDLIGIPWRVAFALQADGWYLRQDIIWHKPNPMPESVTDRCTKAHEYIFLLTKSARYYYDHEAVKEEATDKEYRERGKIRRHQYVVPMPNENEFRKGAGLHNQPGGRLTRNRRSVWTVTTQPFTAKKYGFDVDHFATYPPALIEPCILAGTSAAGQCPHCGAPWERVVEKVGETNHGGYRKRADAPGAEVSPTSVFRTGVITKNATTGWQPTCACPEHAPVPQTVLDPFNGAGTTGLVSIQHRRHYIGIDLSADYLAITRARLAEVQPRLL